MEKRKVRRSVLRRFGVGGVWTQFVSGGAMGLDEMVNGEDVELVAPLGDKPE